MTLAIVVTLIVLILMTLAIFFLLKYEVKKMNGAITSTEIETVI